MILTLAAVLSLATSCQGAVAPTTIVRLAKVESGFDTRAVHRNADGSTDEGLMQINSANRSFLGLADPFDACQSIRAAGRLMQTFSRYNTGSPSKGISNGYAEAAYLALSADGEALPVPPIEVWHRNPFSRPARTGRDMFSTTTIATERKEVTE